MAGNRNSLDQGTYVRLRRLYIIALSAIALSVIVGQILIGKHLKDQENNSGIINIAGRQRMLCQKLTKEILLLSTEKNIVKRSSIKDSLKQTLLEWELAHKILQSGKDSAGVYYTNSMVVSKMFDAINPIFDNVKLASEDVIRAVEANTDVSAVMFNTNLNAVKENEGVFLAKMDRIVNQYDLEAAEKITWLRKLELFLMAFTLIVLLAELLFIFLPTAKNIKKSLSGLIVAEKNAKEMAYNADVLREAKEKSINELQALSRAMDNTLLFARIAPDGTIKHMGNKFSKLFRLTKFDASVNFSQAVSINENEQDIVDDIIFEHNKTGWQGEIKGTTREGVNIWMEAAIIPFNPTNERSELLIIASEITKRKESQLEIERLTKIRFEEKMNQQKNISIQIIENQEKEQNRIAKDVHDGIGQMLTGLKFNLESVDISDIDKAATKIEYLKELTENIIKGVRTATFNLTPPELVDHGVIPALKKLTKELARLTEKEILFVNKTGFNKRLDSLSEINIYRIVQEAVNNAIKHAESSHILITLSHSESILSIVIDDNGKGFDPEKITKEKTSDGGMGMTFMQERVKYIDGRMFLHSEPGKGTRITLNVPISVKT